jgi:two-component system, OmpR family, response regulator VicR
MAEKKCKILMIDDEADFCSSVKGNLEMTGRYEVAVCSEAEKALEQAQAVHPDIILLDVMMPKILGLELAKQLSAQEQTAETPILFITALPLEQEGLEFMVKPVLKEDLKKKIEELLSRKGASQG